MNEQVRLVLGSKLICLFSRRVLFRFARETRQLRESVLIQADRFIRDWRCALGDTNRDSALEAINGLYGFRLVQDEIQHMRAPKLVLVCGTPGPCRCPLGPR